MKLAALTLSLLALANVLPAQAAQPVPGSLLLYPVWRTTQNILCIVSVTNSNLTPAGPGGLGGSTNVHFNYVTAIPNPADPFKPQNCVQFDRLEFLTPGDTFSVSVLCHNPSVGEGYLVVHAEDVNFPGGPWSHNYLTGSTIHIDPGSNVVYSMNALTYRAIQDEHSPTDLNGNGRCDLDGVEYEMAARGQIVDYGLGAANPRLCLVNLTGASSDMHRVTFTAFNDNEYPLSLVVEFSCWFDQRMSVVSPIFTDAFLSITPHDPQELDVACVGVGLFESYWCEIRSLGVVSVDGENVADVGAFVGQLSGVPGGRELWGTGEYIGNGSLVN